MKKAKLILSDNGTTAHIEFSNGKVSLELQSREEALAAINDCYRNSKISEEEKEELIKAVLLAKKLPEQDAETFIIAIALVAKPKQDQPVEMIIDPYAKLCECGNPLAHAYIYDGNDEKVGLPFVVKSEGLMFVEHLLQSKRITEGDAARLNTLIDILRIPETTSMN